MKKYYLITGLDEGVAIEPYVINSQEDDLDQHLLVTGDASRYYKKISEEEVELRREKAILASLEKDLLEHPDSPSLIEEVESLRAGIKRLENPEVYIAGTDDKPRLVPMENQAFILVGNLGIKGFEVAFQSKVEDCIRANKLELVWWQLLKNISIFMDVWGVFESAQEGELLVDIVDYYEELKETTERLIKERLEVK